MQLNVESHKVYTVQGVPISVTGIAQVCIKGFFVCYTLIPVFYAISDYSDQILGKLMLECTKCNSDSNI